MIQLRPYQREALNQLYQWYTQHTGYPCIVAPTGAGKTVLIAQFCKENLETHPNLKILVITHVKELIEQDYNKLLEIWPEASCGIYSATIKRRETDKPITFCAVQSIVKHISEFGKVNIIIVDEAHLISHKETGSYRTIISELQNTNPKLTVVGLTATPYRLGHGLITEGSAIFSPPLIETVGIEDLQRMGHLAYLRSKMTQTAMDISGVKIDDKTNDFVEKDLQAKIDTPLANSQVVEEMIRLTADRRHILVFCCGIDHARHISDEIRKQGETADYLIGNDNKKIREERIRQFKNGEIRFLTNVNVLSTGFDFPDIDGLVMLRPTMSPGLYIQQAGRGLRPKSFGGNCLVLDFAGNVQRHGPITHVTPPSPKGKNVGKGVAASKVCPSCDEIVAIQARVCSYCGYEWPKESIPKTFILHDDDIQGNLTGKYFRCTQWQWLRSKSKKGNDMVVVNFYGKRIRDGYLSEFFMLWRTDRLGGQARTKFTSIMKKFGLTEMPKTDQELTRILEILSTLCTPPFMVEWDWDEKKEHKRVKNYIWKGDENAVAQQA